MIQTGIIPDLHGSNKWKNAIREHPEVDNWVFLGDYVDSFIYDDETMIKNLRDVIALKLKYKNRVKLLIGNHDIHYMFLEPYYKSSGFRETIQYTLNELFNKYKELFDVAISVNGLVLSHAGITESWYTRFKVAMFLYGIEITTNNMIHWMNASLKHGPKKILDIICHVGKVRGGYEANGGPLWADARELKNDPLQTINQIVGHTPQKEGKIVSLKLPTGESLIFTDTGEINPLNPLILQY